MCVICEKKYNITDTTLNCSNCEKITTIPSLPKLEILDCHNCCNLVVIPTISKLVNINCHSCNKLNILNYYPNLRYLNTANCPNLKIPKISKSIQVHVTKLIEERKEELNTNLTISNSIIRNENDLINSKLNNNIMLENIENSNIILENSKLNNNEPEIYYGKRDESFKKLIQEILTKSKIKSKYIDIILKKENMIKFDHAFTSKTVNKDYNFEIYEQLGDVTANKFITWYMYKRFPKLNNPEGVKIVARLKINYCAKKSFYMIANSLHFWDFISSSVEERNTRKKALLEDCFESFIGVTESILDENFGIGVGYGLLYNILKFIFDKIPISLKYEDLYDAKTRLKELFDVYKENLSQLIYTFNKTEDKLITCNVFCHINGKYTFLGDGIATNKPESEQKSSKTAIHLLSKMGISKKQDDYYNSII
jgi:dsRNA-specific ribonuclease